MLTDEIQYDNFKDEVARSEGQGYALNAVCPDAAGKRLGEVELRACVGAGLFKQPRPVDLPI